MNQINPMRGPLELPRIGPLGNGMRPELYETVVLKARSGKLLTLPVGESPTFGQRLVGGFTQAYFIRMGYQNQTFTTTVPTADIGIDLVCEVDVELEVDDCENLVRNWIGDVGEQLGKWCRSLASETTTGHQINISGNAGRELAEVERKVAQRLQTNTQRPQMHGLKLRELRVRLRFAKEEIVSEFGGEALISKLKAKQLAEVTEMYESVFGRELAQVIALVGGDQEKIVAVAERLQTEYQVNGQRRIDLFRELVNSPTIEVHIRERLAMELGKQLGTGDEKISILSQGILEAPKNRPQYDDDDEQEH